MYEAEAREKSQTSTVARAIGWRTFAWWLLAFCGAFVSNEVDILLFLQWGGHLPMALVAGFAVAFVTAFGNKLAVVCGAGVFVDSLFRGQSALAAFTSGVAIAITASVSTQTTTRLSNHKLLFRELGVAIRLLIGAALGGVVGAVITFGGPLLLGTYTPEDALTVLATAALASFLGIVLVSTLLTSLEQISVPRLSASISSMVGSAVLCLLVAAVMTAALVAQSDFNFRFPSLSLTALLAMVVYRRAAFATAAALAISAVLLTTFVPIRLIEGDLQVNLLALQVYLGGVLVAPVILSTDNFWKGRPARLAASVLIVSSLLSAALFCTLIDNAKWTDRRNLEQMASHIETSIRDRLRLFEYPLLGGKGLFAVSDSIQTDEWRAYVQSLNLHEKLPGVQGVGITRPVSEEQIPAFLKHVREAVDPNFEIRASAQSSGPPQSFHYIVTYVEPIESNPNIRGIDASTDPGRRSALESARDSGDSIMTKVFVPVVSKQAEPAFLLYVPFYERGKSTKSVEERRLHIKGWVGERCNVSNFFGGIESASTSQVNFRITDGGELGQAPQVYRSEHFENSDVAFSSSMVLAGRLLTIEWAPARSFVYAARAPAMLAGLLAALSGLILTVIVRTISSLHLRAEAVVLERTKELQRHRDDLLENERRLTEQSYELALARDKAVAATDSKSLFLASMSHEIRTPMTALLGFSQALAEGEMSIAERTVAVRSIRRNVTHLRKLIEDVLDLSKIEAGRLEIECIPFSLFELLSDIEQMFSEPASDKGLRFFIRPTYPLPRTISTDPTRLKQILINLLSNAIKFTEEGSVRLDISYERDENVLRFTVEDTGIGITPDEKERIFTAFVQGSLSTNRAFGGSGLGLVISNEYALRLGGEIVLLEGSSGGTRFVVTIRPEPVEEVDMLMQAQNSTLVPRDSDRSTPVQLHGHVLLAEDGVDNREFIYFTLRKLGLTCSMVVDGEQAVEAALENTFDLILMDVHMPGLDGYRATEMLRKKGYTGPIVALTADILTEIRDQCVRSGCDDFIGKPFSRQEFIAKLSKFLSVESARATAEQSEEINPIVELIEEDFEFISIVEHFFERVPNQLAQLEETFISKQMKELTRLAHSCKGAAANLHFDGVREAAQKLEVAAKNEELELIPRMISELGMEFERAVIAWTELKLKRGWVVPETDGRRI